MVLKGHFKARLRNGSLNNNRDIKEPVIDGRFFAFSSIYCWRHYLTTEAQRTQSYPNGKGDFVLSKRSLEVYQGIFH